MRVTNSYEGPAFDSEAEHRKAAEFDYRHDDEYADDDQCRHCGGKRFDHVDCGDGHHYLSCGCGRWKGEYPNVSYYVKASVYRYNEDTDTEEEITEAEEVFSGRSEEECGEWISGLQRKKAG